MGKHIAFKLTKGGGPEPQEELRRVYEAAQSDCGDRAWIATRKPGTGFTWDLDSRLLAFTEQSKGKVLVLTARIESRSPELPDDALALDMYGEFRGEMRAYWRIRDVGLGSMAKRALPGRTTCGKSVADAFVGSLSFAYWLPSKGPGD